MRSSVARFRVFGLSTRVIRVVVYIRAAEAAFTISWAASTAEPLKPARSAQVRRPRT